MDGKVFRMAILTIISAFVLVMVIVYATNTERINEIFGWGQKKEAVTEEASAEDASVTIIYGDQIGDSLNAFLLDEDFFDETEKIPSVIVRKKNTTGADAGSLQDSAGTEDGDEEPDGTGMAIVGELTNPNPVDGADGSATDSSGYLTSLPDPPPGGYGQYIPSDQTITGTQVGTP